MKQWIELGDQTKKAQEELFILMELINQMRLPQSYFRYVNTSLNALQKVKAQGEDRMFKEYPALGEEAFNIFYDGKYMDF